MPELTPRQMQVLERLFAAGFRPIAIPPYESALCMRRGECAVVLSPVQDGGLRVLTPPTILVEGHLGVRLKRGNAEVFVWKGREVAATAARASELEKFCGDLREILEQGAVQ